jgi:hypothetical protein
MVVDEHGETGTHNNPNLRNNADSLGGLLNQLRGNVRIEIGIDLPRQDSPRKVVDDRVQVDSTAVKQAQNAGVEVPDLVWSSSTNANFRLGWINSLTRPPPTGSSCNSTPCRWTDEGSSQSGCQSR